MYLLFVIIVKLLELGVDFTFPNNKKKKNNNNKNKNPHLDFLTTCLEFGI